MKDKWDLKGLQLLTQLDMDGVTNYHKPGELNLWRCSAGNDILPAYKKYPPPRFTEN